jgi:hypothetical protein
MNSDIKVFIGTANFGRNYGHAKAKNFFSNSEIHELLARVSNNKDYFLDTAQNYGDAEALIGQYAAQELNDKICTKIRVENSDSINSLVNKVKNSLHRVKQDRFYSVLIHNSEIIRSGNFIDLISALYECINLDLTLKIGISCYEIGEINSVAAKTNLSTHFQIPENVSDRRNQNNPDLNNLYNSGVSITIRSIFLQGMLLLNTNKIPNFFLPSLDVFESIEDFSKLNQVSKLKYCLDYIRTIKWNDGIVLGIENLDQLDQISTELNSPILVNQFDSKTLNPYYADPRNWKND